MGRFFFCLIKFFRFLFPLSLKNNAQPKPDKSDATKGKTLIVIGDSGVGKTCLLISYTANSFKSEYDPTVFDSYVAQPMVDGKPYHLLLLDIGRQENCERIFRLLYQRTDFVLLCFSINDRSSLENIGKKWIPEIQHHLPRVGQLLVGCKTDLRDSNAETCITTSEAEMFASDHNLPYCETSARTRIGLKACFNNAIIEIR